MKWFNVMRAVALVAVIVAIAGMLRSCQREEISADKYGIVQGWCANDEKLAAWVRLSALSDGKITGQEFNEIWANVDKFQSNKIKDNLLKRGQ